MRVITQFKPNMSFKDYYKSMKPGDVFMFKNNPLIYMVTDEPALFVNEWGTALKLDYYYFTKSELRVIVRREDAPLSTVYSTLDYMF